MIISNLKIKKIHVQEKVTYFSAYNYSLDNPKKPYSTLITFHTKINETVTPTRKYIIIDQLSGNPAKLSKINISNK